MWGEVVETKLCKSRSGANGRLSGCIAGRGGVRIMPRVCGGVRGGCVCWARGHPGAERGEALGGMCRAGLKGRLGRVFDVGGRVGAVGVCGGRSVLAM